MDRYPPTVDEEIAAGGRLVAVLLVLSPSVLLVLTAAILYLVTQETPMSATAAAPVRSEGDLLEIIEAGEFSRLRPDDRESLEALVAHYQRRHEQSLRALDQCPPPDLDPFGDDVSDPVEADDRGPGDELPGIFPTTAQSVAVLGAGGTASIAAAWLFWRSAAWLFG